MELLKAIFISLVRGFVRVFAPNPTALVHAAGDPNVLGTFCFAVPCDSAFETTPTTVEVGLLGCPTGLGVQMELQYVGFRSNTLPIDSAGTGTILCDIEWIDDSAADAVTNLNSTAVSLEADAMTALVVREVWSGSKILDPGDAINAEITSDGTGNTASEGAAFIVMGRILSKSSA